MLLGDELDRHFIFFGDGSFCVFRNRREVYTGESIPKVRFILHPRNPRAFGIEDDELEPGEYITKFFDKIDEIPLFKSEKHSFIIITKDIFGHDTPMSLEFEHLTSKIVDLQKELESLRGESIKLLQRIDQIKNRPDEYLAQRSHIFDRVSLVRKTPKEDEEEESSTMR